MQQRSPPQGFNKLSTLLTTPQDPYPLLEIEILPKALQGTGHDILRDGHCIGVPKQLMLEAFVAARHCLFAEGVDTSDLSDDILLGATAILLLSDPEHLTAANTRKRRIRRIDCCRDQPELEKALKGEMWLLDSFLTSPLKKHTKSPTLWAHRYWLHSAFGSFPYPSSPHKNGVPYDTFLSSELEIVIKAGEQHPKNYYAYDYARKLVRVALQQSHDEKRSLNLESFVQRVHEWCTKHPSDISGWSFLLFLSKQASNSHMTLDIVLRTIDMASNIEWHGEALWKFVRESLADDAYLGDEDRLEMLRRLRSEACRRSSVGGQVSSGYGSASGVKAVNWIDKHWRY